jgi:hypothetical protein
MEKKKTSVDWLVDEIEKHYITNNGMLDPTVVMPLKRQAKQMEKEQVEDAYQKGRFSGQTNWGYGNDVTAEQFYKETYEETKTKEKL